MKNKLIWLVLFLTSSFIFGGCESKIEESLAPVEAIDILIAESFPVQVYVKINGYLPTPCFKISRIEQHREENTFYITIMIKDSGKVCIQVIEPYQQNVSLEVYGLPAGTYQVNVNGVMGSFTLDVDNILLPDIFTTE